MYFHCTKYLRDQIQNFCEKAWSQMQKQNEEDDDDDDDVLMCWWWWRKGLLLMLLMLMMMCGQHLQPSNEILLTREIPPIAFLPSPSNHHDDDNDGEDGDDDDGEDGDDDDGDDDDDDDPPCRLSPFSFQPSGGWWCWKFD